jgi:hypothetical protein
VIPLKLNGPRIATNDQIVTVTVINGSDRSIVEGAEVRVFNRGTDVQVQDGHLTNALGAATLELLAIGQ